MNAITKHNDRAVIGGNNPPDPIDEATAPFEDAIHEAANWLDGSPVENEAQMRAVDAILADIKAWRKALDAAKKSATAPLHDAWKAEIARWKPTEEDQQRIEKGLVAAVDGYKRKLAAEKAEAERKAQQEAWEAMRAARAAAEAAAASDLEAQRAADAAKREAEEAVERARAASKDTVKGLRTYDVTEVLDGTGLARWIWQNDRDPLMAWLDAERAEAERKAQREAWEAMRAARAAAEAAAASDLEAQRAADAAKREAEEAVERARAASKDTVKGLRTYDVTEVLDGTGLARWIWQNDREPLMAWLDEYARRRKLHIPGIVETRQERRAV